MGDESGSGVCSETCRVEEDTAEEGEPRDGAGLGPLGPSRRHHGPGPPLPASAPVEDCVLEPAVTPARAHQFGYGSGGRERSGLAAPQPEPKRRRLRGKQADPSGACVLIARGDGPLGPSSPKRRRLQEPSGSASGSSCMLQHETCASLINRAFMLSDDCSISAVWQAAELHSAAGEAAYDDFIQSAGFADGAMQTSQPLPGLLGREEGLHDDFVGSVVVVSADPLCAVGNAACAASSCCELIATTSDVVAADAAGEADGRGSPRGCRQHLGYGASAFDLPPEDDLLDHEQLSDGEPCDADDEDAFDFGSDLGPSAYHN